MDQDRKRPDLEMVKALAQRTLRAIVGPTASGKTALAVAVCEALGQGQPPISGEVVSLDSMLVYRGLNIGTAKPSLDERKGVPHHLIDVADPTERYDVSQYSLDAQRAEEEILSRGGMPIFTGGTSFYLKALLSGLFNGPDVDPKLRARLEARYDVEGAEALHKALRAVDPALAERVHANDKKRVVRGLEVFEQTGTALGELQKQWASDPRPSRLVGLEVDVVGLDERILARTKEMFRMGWPEEAEAIRKGTGFGKTSIQALGYRDVLRFVDGELTRDEAIAEIALRTRQFSRRQRTWLRGFQEIRWFAAPKTNEDLVALAPEVLDWIQG
ncbi:MAG: tRNA (adenosine(37)-N6)-dimethylallyltransferase MiaA [Planctomycetota bacterium]|nr:tRNA (adenosine(37)-N6)-dimethylallyltransferase MiaA [Planctomycetota bacterium]